MGVPHIKQNHVRKGKAQVTDAETGFRPTLSLAEKRRL
jgi:hypothetical protein